VRVQVLYFAVFREKLGRDEETLELSAGAHVRDAVAALAERHAPIASLRTKFRVAVNQEFVTDEHALADGDELALIPPVAGGSDARHVRLLDTPLSIDRCVAAVTHARHGAIVTFAGVVRDHSRGVGVTRLDYEAYAAMAVREMTAICTEVEAEVADTRIALEHRVGTLTIGDLAVVIAVGAPHRVEAFTACRAVIDRLKERVPIWKKEHGDDGTVWVGLGP
jgi:molybdopterin synthase catalytic subunit